MVKLKDMGLTTVVLVVALLCILNASGAWSQLDPEMIFLNINCGSSVDVEDTVTKLTWYGDDKYITTGATSSNVPNFRPELNTLRFFNDTRLPKYCYELPVLSSYTYMLKVHFYYGRYDNGNSEPTFQMTIDGLVVENVTTSLTAAYYFEYTYTAQGNTTFVCFLRDQTKANPFISSLSLRRARVYPAMSYSLRSWRRIAKAEWRWNFGGTTSPRYPDDTYDRIWTTVDETGGNILTSTTSMQRLNSSRSLVYLGGNPDYAQVPTKVLQSALTSSGSMTLRLPTWKASKGALGFLILHFAELDPAVNETSRVFTVSLSSGRQMVVNPFNQSQGTNAPMLWSFDEIASNSSEESVTFTPGPSSIYGPMINAAEWFTYRLGLAPAKTRNLDAEAINGIKSSLKLQEWNGDPCVPVPHTWVNCSTVNDPTISPTIESVNLSNYKLAGTIPPAFATLGALTTLILSSNNLTGDLPDLRRLTHLERLHLQDNNLTGPLPAWLGDLKNLTELFVQNNDFTGPIPRALNRSTLNFVYTPGNPLLIGLEQDSRKTSIWVIVGPVVGGGVAVLAAVIIAIVCYCKKRRSTNDTSPTNVDRAIGSVDGAVPNIPNARAFTAAEISKATDNFSKEIGKGAFGTVYYGKLPNGVEVAVKVLARDSTQGATEFSNEVNVLSRVHHKNLVSLLGFCNEHKKQMLVYEYLSEGSLRHRLNGTSHSGEFDFKARVNVALNAAQGLEYLHNSCSPSIVHRDIKSSNILLTNTKDVAKVADFGLSRLAPHEEDGSLTFIKGTRGYIDPEYVSTHYLTWKSDVYSFGVVLLELLTGRVPFPSGPQPQADIAWTICDWVRNTLQRDDDVSMILDPVLKTSQHDKEAVWKMTEIAMMCVEPKSIHRPTMIEVVNELRGTLAMEEAKSSKTSYHQRQHSRGSSPLEFNSTGLSLSDPHWPTPR